jgi:hypothetical protein
MPVEHWKAWKLGERESIALRIGQPVDLEEALAPAVADACWQPRDILAIQRSHDGRGEYTLWQFTVKRSTKVGTWRESSCGGGRVFVGRMEPKPLGTPVALAAPFAPVEPFDAFRDNPVGLDLSLVNQ